MMPVIVYIMIIIGMNVVDNLNSVTVINKPCVCSRTMRLSTFCGPRCDQEQFIYNWLPTPEDDLDLE
jgi:hypothetical protein